MTTKLAKHTPGPWEVTNRMPAFECVAIVECSPDHALTIDAVGSRRPTQDEWEANARLIAAAPVMLEALKSTALTFAEPKQDFRAEKNAIQHSYAMICAAIRAAVGEQEENTQQ